MKKVMNKLIAGIIAIALIAMPVTAMAGETSHFSFTNVMAEEKAFAVYSIDDDSLTFYYGVVPEEGTEYNSKIVTNVYAGFEIEDYNNYLDVPWEGLMSSIVYVVIDESFEVVQPISLAYWFYGFNNASFIGLENIDTSKVESLAYTFSGCENLLNVDSLKNWNTSKVITMESTFEGCGVESVDSLDLWDVRNVVSLRLTFSSCSSLVNVNLSDWNTRNVRNMSYTFESKSIETIDITGWNTENVTNCEDMFGDTYVLDWLKIGDDFDLFIRFTDIGVNNPLTYLHQYWYSDDKNGTVISDYYMSGLDNSNSGDDDGKYWTHTTGSITVSKIDAVTKDFLEGAEFKLTASGLSGGNFTFTTDKNGQYVMNIYADLYGYVTLYDKNDNIISNSNVSFFGCTLEETKAPDGYLLAESVSITVGPVVGESLVYNVEIKDATGAVLPNAGGMRTLWGIIIGSAVVAAGITYAATENRRRNKQKIRTQK